MPAVDLSSSSDADLARGILARESEATRLEAELCRRFASRVRLFGLRHLRDAAAADDLMQRVLLLTLQKLREGAVRNPEKVGSFILGVARTLVREDFRAHQAEPFEEAATEMPNWGAVEGDPQLRIRLGDCMERLAERERSVLVMTFFNEQGANEIGSSLGMNPNHVRVTRHRAVTQLRDCLGLSRAGAARRDGTGKEAP